MYDAQGSIWHHRGSPEVPKVLHGETQINANAHWRSLGLLCGRFWDAHGSIWYHRGSTEVLSVLQRETHINANAHWRSLGLLFERFLHAQASIWYHRGSPQVPNEPMLYGMGCPKPIKTPKMDPQRYQNLENAPVPEMDRRKRWGAHTLWGESCTQDLAV